MGSRARPIDRTPNGVDRQPGRLQGRPATLMLRLMLPQTAAAALAAAILQPAVQPGPAAVQGIVETRLDELDPARLIAAERPMRVEVGRDPITDSLSAFAVASERGGSLAIGCDPDRYRGIRVSFRSKSWLASENLFTGNRRMTYRFDRQAPIRGRWDIDGDQATLRPLSHVPGFVASAAGATMLTIRSRDIEDRERDLAFSLIGARGAIVRMLELCDPSRSQGTAGGR